MTITFKSQGKINIEKACLILLITLHITGWQWSEAGLPVRVDAVVRRILILFTLLFAKLRKRITLGALIPFSLRRRTYLLIKFISFLPKVDYLAILESFLFY